MQIKFLKSNDTRLTKVSQVIPEGKVNSPAVKKIIEKMLKIIRGERKGHKKGVGLAAPQIGILKRIILVDVKANGIGKTRPAGRQVGDLRIYVNPEIVWKSKREEEWYEGCFSTGNVCGIVSRPTSIKIRAFMPQPGRLPHKLITDGYSGYVARIFQHEIDHLNGKVFVDHIQDPNKLHWVEEHEFPLYRNKKAWRNWPKKCSRSKWEKIKKGQVPT